MKSTLAILALSLAAPLFAAETPSKPAQTPYKNDDERTVYTIGYMMGRNLAAFNLNASEIKVIAAGLADSIKHTPPTVDIQAYQGRINDMMQQRTAAAAVGEKAKGKAYVDKFLKENKAVAITGGGWYLEEKAGTGPMPTKTDTIKAHYRGTTVDGAEFDSSYARNEPTDFELNRVIPCWTNGFAMMKVGTKAKLICPSDVAYGDPGRPGIKPGATLLFDVEFIEIVKPENPAPASDKSAKKK
ncbi:MAG: FKBP-type peptidyl-prolyl cis-trans isomerase [Elusimicrobiota bacterium]